MSLPEPDLAYDLPVTSLRRSFEHARACDTADQVREIVERLVHPEDIAEEVLDAYRVMQICFDLDAPGKEPKPDDAIAARPRTVVEDYIWATRELTVLGGKCSFTCIATNVDPLARPSGAEGGLSDGLDYVGLTCDSSSTLVLGAVQSPGDVSAYPLLLRLFACLTEIVPPAQFERINQRHMMGIGRESSQFDLNLVLWDRNEETEASTLCELTRDLAEKMKAVLGSDPDFPSILRDVVCMRMNPDCFDGRMRLEWRI